MAVAFLLLCSVTFFHIEARGGRPIRQTTKTAARRSNRYRPNRITCHASYEWRRRATAIFSMRSFSSQNYRRIEGTSLLTGSAIETPTEISARMREDLGGGEEGGNVLPEGDETLMHYLDNAERYKKPEAVLDAVDRYYATDNANVHRGAHELAARATAGYEGARLKVAQLIGGDDREVVYTKSATEGINLLANTWGDSNIKSGDEIILSVMEDHSNIIPWQRLAQRKGATIKYVRLNDDFAYDLEHLKSLLSERTKLVATTHASSVLGTRNPAAEVADLAHQVGAVFLLDASQTMARGPLNVDSIGCDFLVASGHTMMAPYGIGFLWGKYKLLDAMKPWQGGGEMIDEVFLEKSTYAPPPGRFEAGTPSIAETIGLGASIDIIMETGTMNILEKELRIGEVLYKGLTDIPSITILGGPKERLGIASFVSAKHTPEEMQNLLKKKGYRIGAGLHSSQPLHQVLGYPHGSNRVSFSMFDTENEARDFIQILRSCMN